MEQGRGGSRVKQGRGASKVARRGDPAGCERGREQQGEPGREGEQHVCVLMQ